MHCICFRAVVAACVKNFRCGAHARSESCCQWSTHASTTSMLRQALRWSACAHDGHCIVLTRPSTRPVSQIFSSILSNVCILHQFCGNSFINFKKCAFCVAQAFLLRLLSSLSQKMTKKTIIAMVFEARIKITVQRSKSIKQKHHLVRHSQPKFTSDFAHIILAYSAWKVVHLNSYILQGSAATDFRWDEKLNSNCVRTSFLDATLKELLKLVYICKSY